MGSNVTHTKIVHGQWDCAPFWFANEKVDVGDFGTIDNKCFKRGRHKNELQGSCRQERVETASLVSPSSQDYDVKSMTNPPNVGAAQAKVMSADKQGVLF
jgi:hypothetical protein